MPLPKSNARKNKTNVVSTANPRGDETSAAAFDIEITFSIFLDKKTARASENAKMSQLSFYFLPGLLNCLYATRNNSDRAFAVSAVRFLSARR